jgi:uncharacterized protein
MKKIFFLLMAFLSFQYGYTQTTRIDSINIIIKPRTDKMLIRWMPSNHVVWLEGVTNGYYLERKVVERNGSSVSEPYVRLYGGLPVKHLDLNAYQTWLFATQRTENDPASRNYMKTTTDSVYHLIAAQAIFRDPNKRDPNRGSTVDTLRQDTLHTPQENRYNFAMIGVNMSYTAAKMSGLGFDDVNVLPNEKYVYRVVLATTNPVFSGVKSELSKTVGTTNTNNLPIIPKPKYKFSIKQAELNWKLDTLGIKDVYIGYHVERSTNGVNYTRLNKQIIVKAYNGEPDSVSNYLKKSTANDFLAFKDETILNKTTYYYRIVGKTLFDEIAYSAPISGMAIPEYAPTIKFADMVSATSVRLNWEFLAPLDSGQTVRNPNEVIPVKKYYIERGANDLTFVLVKDNISPTDTTVVLDFPKGGTINADDAHYLRITAVPDLADAKNFTSGVVLVQPIDSIAPFAPIILGATSRILTKKELGEVTLTYKPDDRNTDVVGYHIFRSDRAGNEMVQISDTLQTATYKDTINTTLLNDVILYRVLAVDKRGNRSPLSDSIVVQRPDIIPPTAPIIKNLNTIKTGVELRWIRGKDRDQNLSHSIFKKLIPTDSEWTIVVENLTQESDTVYVDKNVLAGKRYVYIVVAVDKSTNKSISTPRIIDVPNSLAFAAEITSIKAYANRTKKAIDINWETKGENFSQFQIYRAIYPNSLASWNIMSGDELATVDRSVDKLVKYRYAIRGVLADGSVTRWITTDVEYPDDCETNFKIVRTTELDADTIDEACEIIELKPGFDSKKKNTTDKKQYKTKLPGQL